MPPNGPNAQVDHGSAALDESHGRSDIGGVSDFDSFVVAFRQAYRENYKDLLRYAQSRVCSKEVAQDIVQQAFTNTLMAIERGADIHNLGGFVQRCVHNLCVNHTLREPQVQLHEGIVGMSDCSTAASAEHRVRWSELEGILNRLAPSQRDVFLLAEVRGCSYEEIAQTTDRSIDSVRQLLFRARRAVRATGGSKSGFVLGPFPALGSGRVFDAGYSVDASKIGIWARGKASDFYTWLGGFCQGSSDALLQPGVSVVTGVVVVALAAVSPSPVTDPGLHGERADSSFTQKSKHSGSRPSTNTASRDIVDIGQTVIPRSPLGNARDSVDGRESENRDAPAKRHSKDEPVSIIASDPDNPGSPVPGENLSQIENTVNEGQPEDQCGPERVLEQCDGGGPKASNPGAGNHSTDNHVGAPPGNPLGKGPVENLDEPSPVIEDDREDTPDMEEDLDPQMEQNDETKKDETSTSL